MSVNKWGWTSPKQITWRWQRGASSEKKGKYSRQHTWVLAGTKLRASETGAVTPAAYHDNTPIDPYNMFVATVASAHMLTWLHMAFSLDVEVDRYVDRAYGVLTGLESGDCWISEVSLHPKITLKAGYEMTAATMAQSTYFATSMWAVNPGPTPALGITCGGSAARIGARSFFGCAYTGRTRCSR